MTDSKTVHESLNSDSVEVTIRRNKQGAFEYTGFNIKAYGELSACPPGVPIGDKLNAGRAIVAALLEKGAPGAPGDKPSEPE